MKEEAQQESSSAQREQPEEEKKPAPSLSNPVRIMQKQYDEDIGGIDISTVDQKGTLKQEKEHEINRHLPKGVRRAGIRTKRKKYAEDDIEKGEVFLPQTEPFQMTLGDPEVPYGLWRGIEQMRKGEKAKIMVKPRYGYAMPDYSRSIKFPEGWGEGERLE